MQAHPRERVLMVETLATQRRQGGVDRDLSNHDQMCGTNLINAPSTRQGPSGVTLNKLSYPRAEHRGLLRMSA